MLDRLIQEENLNGCHECVIQHPSQREHSCLMMDSEEAWLSYHDEVREKTDANNVLKNEQCLQSYWLQVGQFMGNLGKRATQVSLDEPVSYLFGTRKVW